MLTTTMDRLNPETRKDINELFLNAALAYAFGASWKRVFVMAKHRNSGFVKRFASFWLEQTDKEMDKAITIFFGG